MSPDVIRRSLVRRGSNLAATVVNEANRLVRSRSAIVERADANRAFLEAVENSDQRVTSKTRRARRDLLDHLQHAEDGTTRFALTTGRTAWANPAGVFGKALALVETAVDQGELDYAKRIVEQLLTERPQSPRAHDLRGTLAAASGDWPAARKDWRLALRRQISDAEGLRKAVESRVQREKTSSRLRAAVLTWSGTPSVDGLDEPARSRVGRVLEIVASPRRGEELEVAVETLLVQTVITDETAVVAALFDACATVRRSGPSPAEPDWLVSATAEAATLADDGDFAAAELVLEQAATRPGALRFNQLLLTWGRLLSSTSRYESARSVLGLVTAPPEDVAQAQFQRARIAWLTHRYEDGEVAAQATLDADPERQAARRLLDQIRSSAEIRSTADPVELAGSVAHVAFYPGPSGNFGDVALPGAVRAAIETATAPTTWRPYHAHQVVDDVTVDQFNAQRAVVVGGGGLFLPDTSPNGSSGWQWNVDNDHLDRITAPLVLFAVGYNLFPGQTFKGTLFRQSLEKVAEKSLFIGLRNHGSIDQVRSILPGSLQDKVRYVPCPTTIMSRIRPLDRPPTVGTGRVLLNAAFDRSSRRFGDSYREFLQEMVRLIDGVRASGAEIAYAAHLASDERLVGDLRKSFDRELPVERLYAGRLDESLTTYRDASLVIGMRGHATMIPFGLGTPVLSIVSHPKMRYFLDDIGRPDWAFDADTPDLGARLLESTLDIVDREAEVRRDVLGLQEQLVEPVFSAARSIVG